MLRSLVRAYVLNELMHTVVGSIPTTKRSTRPSRSFVLGLPAFASSRGGRASGPLRQELAYVADQEEGWASR